MLAKLLQHVLIWVGATVSILLGTLWGQSVGFVSHRMDRRVLAWTILSLSLIFAAALVQRAPAAVAVLTLLTALLGGFGLWLLADGSQATGLIYFVTALVYLATLGPSCYRWLSSRFLGS